MRADIAIAGGGVAGLTAALAFASDGFTVVIVDPVPPVTKAEAAGSDLRSTAFLMPSIQLFERIGLWEHLAPHAAPLRVMRLVDAGGPRAEMREVADFNASEIGQQVFGYNLPNWLLRREMLARLEEEPRATFLPGRALSDIVVRDREVRLALSDGTRITADLLVGADGRNSFVRRAHGIGAQTVRYGQKALVFAVEHGMPHDGISTEVHRTGGPFTLVPLPDADGQHRSAVVWMERGAEAERLMALDPAAFGAEATERSCGVLGSLTLASDRRMWPIISQRAERLTAPRTALVAEAAHVVPPIGAQGLNMSLADISELLDLAGAARQAGRDIAEPALLSRYARARAPEVALRIAGIDVLNRAAMAVPQPLRDLRRLGLRTLHGVPPLKQAAMRLGLGG